MIVECQQRNIFKIRDKIPGHGPREVICRYQPLYNGSEHVLLACGCSIPIPWLPLTEQQAVHRSLKPAATFHITPWGEAIKIKDQQIREQTDAEL